MSKTLTKTATFERALYYSSIRRRGVQEATNRETWCRTERERISEVERAKGKEKREGEIGSDVRADLSA